MKRIFIISALILLSTFVALGQEYYYCSVDEKHYLNESTSNLFSNTSLPRNFSTSFIICVVYS